jgi:hypothetical protein
MASEPYRVLKKIEVCPTNGSAYSLTVIEGSRPDVKCPDGLDGHTI